MLDGSQWAGPPPLAAQPMGIQSTAGAVPIMNEKGEVSMKKVKVHRYVSGKRPEYAPASSDDELTDEEDFTAPKTAAAHSDAPPILSQAQLTEAELSDPRLKRLLAQRQQTGPPRRIAQAEVIEGSDREEDEADEDAEAGTEDSETSRLRHRLADAELDSDSAEDETAEVDEEALAMRRQKMRERAMSKIQQEEEIMGKEDEGSDESSEEDSEEYSDESDSEAEGPRMKPVFVRKKDRLTIQQRESVQQSTKQAESELRHRQEERRREMLRLIESENRAMAPPAAGGMGGLPSKDSGVLGVGADLKHDNVSTNSRLEDVNTDDEADDAEYEGWKLRELRRLKRDKEEQESMQREREDVEKVRHMTEDERRIEQRNNPKTVTNKAVKGKYKFLQKYYHRGAFFLDNEDEVYKRDFSSSTLDDHFDKSILPKVMQVKNFGRSGRTKYTHLVDQDTTTFDSPWAADTQINHKFSNSTAGGMKQLYDTPSTKKETSSSGASGALRK
uniref:Microfibrillar-associated protein 1-like n=1 Tax=Hirondellea gigas TaxID=1518452 RepID=A0A2P2I457_9CRUS